VSNTFNSAVFVLSATLLAACSAESSGDEAMGAFSADLTKGSVGAVVGQSNYCDDPAHPCALGEGDCDSNAQCEVGLLCGRQKSAQFGLIAGDACVPSHCVDKLQNGDETQIDCGGSCGTVCPAPVCQPNGSAERCNSDCLCGIGEGDCDSDAQCQPGLVCAREMLKQFGFPGGDACVPAHCDNKLLDANEDGIDCGGECGTTCTERGCLDIGATYEITFTNSFLEQWPKSWQEHGGCNVISNTYQRTLYATIIEGAVEVDDGIFGGTYPIVEQGVRGFQAHAAGQDVCADYYPDHYGAVTLAFKCVSDVVVFTAECQSDAPGDGCYPNYRETARGTGGLLAGCRPGYALVGDECVDLDECATEQDNCNANATCSNTIGSFTCTCKDGYTGNGIACTDIDECQFSPCPSPASCTNTVGSYECSCEAPAEVCAGACILTDTDERHCGACGATCPVNRECIDGACVASSWTSVTAGDFHSCGLRPNGSIQCWGMNGSGQVAPPATGEFSMVSAGSNSTCGLKIDGSLSCWGARAATRLVPAGTFSVVSLGSYNGCAVRQNGNLVCWGDNDQGQSSPPSGAFVDVSANLYFACGVRADGTLACWGEGYPGTTLPTGTFSTVSVGGYHACALRSDASIACWGRNEYGQATPPSGSFSAVSAGYYRTCALRTDGTLVCWGSNMNDEATPPAGTFTSLSAGYHHSCAVRTDSTVACWGYCFYGGECKPPSP
jgi:alpha-tubulin suppressor-like RCC1 family protein